MHFATWKQTAVPVLTLGFIVAAPPAGAEEAPPAPEAKALAPAGPGNPWEQKTNDLITQFTNDFSDALTALDDANKAIDDALAVQEYDRALARVDQLIARVNNLADRIKPGNATEERVKRLTAEIDAMVATLNADTGLLPEDKQVQLERFGRSKDSLAKSTESIDDSYKQLEALAAELKSRRRAAAYDLISLANENAAQRLAVASEKIATVIKNLRDHIERMRPALTN